MIVYRYDDDNASDGAVYVKTKKEACQCARAVAEDGRPSTVFKEVIAGPFNTDLAIRLLNGVHFVTDRTELVTYEPTTMKDKPAGSTPFSANERWEDIKWRVKVVKAKG